VRTARGRKSEAISPSWKGKDNPGDLPRSGQPAFVLIGRAERLIPGGALGGVSDVAREVLPMSLTDGWRL